jgi:negative regulator of sigma E activity
LEYKYAIRTEYGLAAIEIIRLDRSEIWYLLAQQKELLVSPLHADDTLPLRSELPGERQRKHVGEAAAAGRQAELYEVQVDRDGRAERFYEWVDAETGIVLKLVSRDRDWSFAYERLRLSPKPAYYFEEPLGYKKRSVPVHGGAKG